MSEARVLSAFWNARQKRFVELTANEVLDRSGFTTNSRSVRALISSGCLASEHIKTGGLQINRVIYRLTPAGERRVAAMVVMGNLPKRGLRLTAIPQGEKRA